MLSTDLHYVHLNSLLLHLIFDMLLQLTQTTKADLVAFVALDWHKVENERSARDKIFLNGLNAILPPGCISNLSNELLVVLIQYGN